MITAMIPLDLEQTTFKIVTNICKALKSVDFRMKTIYNNNELTNFIKFTFLDENRITIHELFLNKIIVYS